MALEMPTVVEPGAADEAKVSQTRQTDDSTLQLKKVARTLGVSQKINIF
jgi:hypothetical protein